MPLYNNQRMNNYDIIKKIGQGKFGTVYMAKHKKNTDCVAIKCESVDNPYKSIKHEATILNYLYRCGCRCIPKVLYYGIHDNQVCLIMKYFTVSLEDYVKTHRFDIKQLNRIMICAINILNSIHKHDILHRDIKPANFMFWEKQMFLIDFGMAISMTEDICEDPIKEHIVGTPKYTSYFIHEGYEARPRDDMISLGYTYMSFLSQEVPWSTQGNKETSITLTHISHPDNVFRKNAKSWENMKIHCEHLPHLLHYFDYCYQAETDIEYNLLCDLFL